MVIANHHALEHPLKVGSAGFAIPGHRFAVLDQNYQNCQLVVLVFWRWTRSNRH